MVTFPRGRITPTLATGVCLLVMDAPFDGGYDVRISRKSVR
jgi:hypothetical protein